MAWLLAHSQAERPRRSINADVARVGETSSVVLKVGLWLAIGDWFDWF